MCCSYQHGGHEHEDNARTYPYREGDWCLCPGDTHDNKAEPITRENVAEIGLCCGAASGDDGMCDRCRINCKGNADAAPTQHAGSETAGADTTTPTDTAGSTAPDRAPAEVTS